MKTDPTFSDRDVIRIWTRSLTKKEQENVRLWFLVMEINKENSAKGATLILKIATFFLRSIPGFGLLMNLFLEARDVFGTLLTKKDALQRLGEADIP